MNIYFGSKVKTNYTNNLNYTFPYLFQITYHLKVGWSLLFLLCHINCENIIYIYIYIYIYYESIIIYK